MSATPPARGRKGPLRRLRRMVSGEGLRARLMRGSAFTMVAFGGGQVLRLASNLILTRLLFPEAFGMMVIVNLVLTALSLFSDAGLRVSVVRSERGDDPDFLDTVWTIKIVRGVILWLLACALAWPVAAIYDEPMLIQLLPVAGLAAIVQGAFPTAIATADRHLRLGRVTAVGLGAQALGIASMIVLAIALDSVWALVLGSVVGALAKLFLTRRFLDKARNRLHWDGQIARELFDFGKWILLKTGFTFVAKNADRAILGFFISLGDLGIYTVGYFLATITYSVVQTVRSKAILPLLRMRPLHESRENKRKVFFVKRLIQGGGIAATVALGLVGIPLIDFLYDDRYAMAGPIVVLLSLSMVPRIVAVGVGDILLAYGDSRRAMHLSAIMAVVQTVNLYFGIKYFGIAGAILAPGISTILTHPVRVAYLRRYDGHDSWGEIALFLAGIIPAGLICYANADALAVLFP